MVGTATIYVPQAGTWTFGFCDDDGYELDITAPASIAGGTAFSYHTSYASSNNQGGSDASTHQSLVQVTFPTAGDYNFRYMGPKDGGYGYEEFFGQYGNFTTWNAGTTGTGQWLLVGDTYHGGTALTQLAVVRPLPLVQSTADAQSVIAAVGASSWMASGAGYNFQTGNYYNMPTNEQALSLSGSTPTVNYSNTGSTGNAGNDYAFPGLPQASDLDDFANESKATVTVTTAGTYTFGVNSDEGFKLTITATSGVNPLFTAVTGGDDGVNGSGVGNNVMSFSSQRTLNDTFGTIDLPAGTYNFDLVTFERSGGPGRTLLVAGDDQHLVRPDGDLDPGWRLRQRRPGRQFDGRRVLQQVVHVGDRVRRHRQPCQLADPGNHAGGPGLSDRGDDVRPELHQQRRRLGEFRQRPHLPRHEHGRGRQQLRDDRRFLHLPDGRDVDVRRQRRRPVPVDD